MSIQQAIPLAQSSHTCRKAASWIKLPKQVREDYGTDAEQRLFGMSVMERQLQALVCLSDGTLVCGFRRFICGSLVGMTEFDVTVLTDQLNEAQVKVYRLTENIQRKDLTAWEMWQSCAELMCMHPDWAMRDLATHLHFDPASITRYLSPSRLTPEWQEALRTGKVGVSDCYAASKLASPEAMAGLLTLKLNGATRDQLEAAAKKARTPAVATVKATKVRCDLPGNICVVVTGDAVSLEDSVEALGKAMAAMKKAIQDGFTAKTFAAAMKDRAKKS